MQICFSGRHVFMGYLGDPARTARTIDNQGWLHTGDIGRFDEVRELYLTLGAHAQRGLPVLALCVCLSVCVCVCLLPL